jgi:hypothetical protein
MKVLVEVEKMKIMVPCGAGEQKMKWLGLVAAQRHALALPHGKTRAREESDEKRGFFLPKDVLSDRGSSLDPDMVIKDVLGDGDRVTVELQTVVEVDDIGAPIMSPWQTRAFAATGAASERRARGIASRAAIAEHEAEINAEVQRRVREDERYQRAHEAAALAEVTQAGGYNVVVTGHLETAEESAAALDLDWPALSESLKDLRCFPSATAKEAFKEDLRTSYGDLNRIFVHYAGLGRIGQQHGVSLSEFCHYAHISRLARHADKSNASTEKQERNRILSCFASACARRVDAAAEAKSKSRRRSFSEARGAGLDVPEDDGMPVVRLLSRAEFVAALVHLALNITPGAPTLLDEVLEREEQLREDTSTSHGAGSHPSTGRGPPGGPDRSHDGSPRGASRHAHVRAAAVPESPMAALEHLLAKHVAPFLNARKVGGVGGGEGVLLSAFDGHTVQDAVQVQRVHLKRVFDYYARLPRDARAETPDGPPARAGLAPPPDDGGGDPPLVDINESDPALCLPAFKNILKDSGLMELLFTEDHASEKLDKVSISAFLAVQNDPNFNLELDDLVFVEFLEAYCRVANDMLDASGLDTKLLLGIDMLCELSLNLP